MTLNINSGFIPIVSHASFNMAYKFSQNRKNCWKYSRARVKWSYCFSFLTLKLAGNKKAEKSWVQFLITILCQLFKQLLVLQLFSFITFLGCILRCTLPWREGILSKLGMKNCNYCNWSTLQLLKKFNQKEKRGWTLNLPCFDRVRHFQKNQDFLISSYSWTSNNKITPFIKLLVCKKHSN